ncbi:MAG: peptide chain release factor RF2 [Neisseria sp.]|nr:peptide chain release factor RF2 [Neisseria sp.]
MTQQNSQAKAHTGSAKPKNQRSSETQYLENDEKDGNSGGAPSPVCAERIMLLKQT